MKIFDIRNATDTKIEVWIYSDIGNWDWYGDVTADHVNRLLADHRGKDIDLRINSNGGVVTTAMAIYSGLKAHDGYITAYIDGIAASAASFVAMAADKIVMPNNALMMIHNPWGGTYGEAEDMRKYADLLDKIRGQMVDIYKERSGLSEEEITSMLDEETWLTGKEARELGLSDELTDSIEDAYATANQIVFAGQKFQRDKLGLPEKIAASLERKPLRAHTPQPKEAPKMEPTTTSELRAKFPDLCAALEKEALAHVTDEAKAAVQAATDQAIAAERERMKEIDAIAATIPHDLVEKAKYETGEDAASLALSALKAQAKKGTDYLAARDADTQNLGNADKVIHATTEEDDAVEAQAARTQSAIDRIVSLTGGRRKEIQHG